MSLRSQFIPLAQEPNELAKQVHAVITDIFCRGIQKVQSGKLVGSTLLVIIAYPLGLIGTIIGKIIPLLIFLVIWWFLRDEIANYGLNSNKVILTLGIVAIFYKTIYQDLLSFVLSMVIIITGGGYLRWISNSYLRGHGFAKASYESRTMQGLMEGYATLLPDEYQVEYEEMMNLYHDSKKPESKAKLEQLVTEYWNGTDRPRENTDYALHRGQESGEQFCEKVKLFIDSRVKPAHEGVVGVFKQRLTTIYDHDTDDPELEDALPAIALQAEYDVFIENMKKGEDGLRAELLVFLKEELELADAMDMSELYMEMIDTLLLAEQEKLMDEVEALLDKTIKELEAKLPDVS